MVLSCTLFIWNCMGRLAIRIASGSSHSKPRGDFAHNKTLYQNQFYPILIFFPLLVQENAALQPTKLPCSHETESEQDWPSSHCHGEWMSSLALLSSAPLRTHCLPRVPPAPASLGTPSARPFLPSEPSHQLWGAETEQFKLTGAHALPEQTAGK